jgi:hypothetical protein
MACTKLKTVWPFLLKKRTAGQWHDNLVTVTSIVIMLTPFLSSPMAERGHNKDFFQKWQHYVYFGGKRSLVIWISGCAEVGKARIFAVWGCHGGWGTSRRGRHSVFWPYTGVRLTAEENHGKSQPEWPKSDGYSSFRPLDCLFTSSLESPFLAKAPADIGQPSVGTSTFQVPPILSWFLTTVYNYPLTSQWTLCAVDRARLN